VIFSSSWRSGPPHIGPPKRPDDAVPEDEAPEYSGRDTGDGFGEIGAVAEDAIGAARPGRDAGAAGAVEDADEDEDDESGAATCAARAYDRTVRPAKTVKSAFMTLSSGISEG
jgi:hypothetical protein